MAKKMSDSIYLLAIVSIVAIVGIVVMIGSPGNSLLWGTDGDDLSGQAYKWNKRGRITDVDYKAKIAQDPRL